MESEQGYFFFPFPQGQWRVLEAEEEEKGQSANRLATGLGLFLERSWRGGGESYSSLNSSLEIFLASFFPPPGLLFQSLKVSGSGCPTRSRLHPR